ncbi:hypothetical protein CAter282_3439 [Collimonas arenae]|uniref:Uncharacterized protein n=1 Tax=Collimonas arenae TaxID=279058 RepID=A0A127PTS2_9BURK|nr:hypothetical protein [Collimonas arenae]AMP01231.1 hypothetical protein CAter10_3768 [Collimonas arenae]AMP11128.1 hypothetical protein CAter282_3439 [Collimonas arenae]
MLAMVADFIIAQTDAANQQPIDSFDLVMARTAFRQTKAGQASHIGFFRITLIGAGLSKICESKPLLRYTTL